VQGSFRRQGVKEGLLTCCEQQWAQGVALLDPPVQEDDPPSRLTSRGSGWKPCRTQGSVDGHRRPRASRMAGGAMDVNAFFKST